MAPRHLVVAAAAGLLLAGCKEKQSPAETAAHLQAAQTLYAQHDFAHAQVEVEHAIKGAPASGDAHYLAAQIQEALHNQQAAFGEYARAAMPDANNLPAQLKVVEILVDANQLDAALGRINGTLGSHPGDPGALALRAMVEQRQGSPEKARSDAQAALARAPAQPIANAVLATDALASKNSDKALALIEAGLKGHPSDVDLLRLKALALLQQGKQDGAIAIYQGLVESDPTSPTLRAVLAGLDAAAGQVDAGERVLSDGAAADPSSHAMRLALVAFLAKNRGDAAAEAALLAGIAAQPNDSTLDIYRAEALTRAGKPDEAAKGLQAAADRVPDGPARAAAQLALARLDLEQGNMEQAHKLLDAMLASKPDNDEALQVRAALQLQAGDPARAITDLLAAASRHPRSSTLFTLLADAYRQQGDSDKAADALRKVAFFEPADLAPVTQLADLELKAGKPDLAKQAIGDFVARNPDSLPGRLALVRLAVRSKDWTGAQAAIDQMRRNPVFNKAVTLLTAELTEARGQLAAAMAAYAAILADEPGRPIDRDALTGYVRTAVATRQAGPADTFLTHLATSAATPEDAAAADLAKAAVFQATGDSSKAADARTAAIQAAPKQPTAYLEAATLQRGQPDAAIAILNQGLSAGAPAEPLLMARAAIEDAAGRKDAAIATYRAVIDANPRALVAANNYASLVSDARPQDRQLLADALQPIRRFALSTNPAVLDTLAWLDYRLGDYQTARTLLTRAKADTSPNPALRFHYGAVLIALGDKDAGRSAVKGALGQPAFPGRAEAERLLTE